MRVLLVEDDDLVASGLLAGLRLHGFDSMRAGTGAAADAAMRAGHFEICILDLTLPDEDGLSLLGRWRAQRRDTPVLVLTARDAVHHRIEGLMGGADDYMIKPFDLGELVARVHALIRRSAGKSADLAVHGDLSYKASTGEVKLGGIAVALSRRELALLQALLSQPNQILSAGQLHDRLYGLNEELESNALNVHIHHLRRKLGSGIVTTVRGLGYRLGPAGHG